MSLITTAIDVTIDDRSNALHWNFRTISWCVCIKVCCLSSIPFRRISRTDSSHITATEYITKDLTTIQGYIRLSRNRTCIATTIDRGKSIVMFCFTNRFLGCKFINRDIGVLGRGVKTITTAINCHLTSGSTTIDHNLSLTIQYLTCSITTTKYTIVGCCWSVIRLIYSNVSIASYIGRCCDSWTIECSQTTTIDITI